MGNQFSSVVDTIKETLQGKDIELAQEALKLMQERAEDAIEKFKRNIDAEGVLEKSKHMPIKHSISEKTFIRVQTEDAQKLGDKIGECVNDLAAGKVKDGLVKVVQTSLSGILGGNKGSSKIEKIYSISVNRLGGIERLDAFFWAYNVSSQTLMPQARSVVACYVAISTVDVDALDNNDLLALVSRSFGNSVTDDKELEAIYKVVKDRFDESKDEIANDIKRRR